jgi:hypothetical protein
MKAIRIICLHCGKILQDIPDVFKKDPRVDVEIAYGICEGFCKERLKMLRQLAKGLENKLNK